MRSRQATTTRATSVIKQEFSSASSGTVDKESEAAEGRIAANNLPLRGMSVLQARAFPLRSIPGGEIDVQTRTDLGRAAPHNSDMKEKDLTEKQVSSIPCPTCGIDSGKRCVMHAAADLAERNESMDSAKLEKPLIP